MAMSGHQELLGLGWERPVEVEGTKYTGKIPDSTRTDFKLKFLLSSVRNKNKFFSIFSHLIFKKLVELIAITRVKNQTNFIKNN